MTPRKRREIHRHSKQVEVQVHGNVRELFVNESCSSWYDETTPITGSVWEALAAPLLLLEIARRRRILILGLGGGSTARLLRAMAPDALIVGVELDREVIRAARRWFDLDGLEVEVVHGDAWEVLSNERRRFDLVIEDVFLGPTTELRKPDWLPLPGLERAARLLNRDGLLVSHAIGEWREVQEAFAGLCPSMVRIDIEGHHSRVYVGGPGAISGACLRAAVHRDPVLAPALLHLSFRSVREQHRGGNSGTGWM
jgi:spermidine synthase